MSRNPGPSGPCSRQVPPRGGAVSAMRAPAFTATPGDFLTDDLAFTRVYARPNFEVELPRRLDYCACTRDRSPRPVEATEEPISRRVDLDSSIAVEITTDDPVVLFEHLAPASIPTAVARSVEPTRSVGISLPGRTLPSMNVASMS